VLQERRKGHKPESRDRGAIKGKLATGSSSSIYVFNKHLVSVVRNGDEVHATLHFKKESYDASYEEFQLQERPESQFRKRSS